MQKIAIDIGYSFTKIYHEGKLYKIPSAISYAVDSGINFGSEDVYLFEGQRLYVGEMASNDESFTTTDYNFLYKYAPLIIFHILKKLNLDLTQEIEVRTGLALSDWSKKEDFAQRISIIKLNENDSARIKPILIPQGAGSVVAYVNTELEGKYPDSMIAIDIGYNTINLLAYEGSTPIKNRCKPFPGHGVSSIIRPFTNFMETKFNIPFSEAEAIKIFMKNEFIYNGETKSEVPEMIAELKQNFIQKLINSILVSEKKYLGLSNVVLFSGGGAYYLKDIPMPPNVKFPTSNYEFQNVIGYAI
jgi:plasmid segregation protein ParM